MSEGRVDSIDMNTWGLSDLVKHTYKMLENIDAELKSLKIIVSDNDKETAQKINNLERDFEIFRIEYETRVKTTEDNQKKRHMDTRIGLAIIGGFITVINFIINMFNS
jgi:hypothetical protein